MDRKLLGLLPSLPPASQNSFTSAAPHSGGLPDSRGDSPTPGLPESVVNSVHFSSPVCRPVRGSSASVDRRPQLLLWVRRRESPQNLRTNERKKSRCQERMEIFSMSLIRWKKKSVDGCLNISLMTWRIILGDSILDISRYTRACV